MKSIQGIKLRTYCIDPVDLVLARIHNPLKRTVEITPSVSATQKFLNNYKIPVDIYRAEQNP